MGFSDILDTLLAWTPYLVAGFGMNILISLISMAFGTLLGLILGAIRAGMRNILSKGAQGLTAIFRNIPSFVIMYYIAFVMPVEFEWNNTLISIPSWVKASLALAVPVIGFVSDQSRELFRKNHNQTNHDHNDIALFATAWIQYFLIIFMASSTASVIGVDEIVGRANTVVAATQEPALIVWIYAYVWVWFLCSSQLLSYGFRWSSNRLNDSRMHIRLEE